MRSIVYSLTALLFLFSCSKKKTLFQSLPASKTNIHFENKLPEREGFGILYYIYFYNGGGVATGDINNDGLADIYFTANSKGGNKLYLNKGNLEFEDITGKAGVEGTSDWCTGVTMADVNGDGFLDIYVSAISNTHGLKGHNELFINNRDNSFTEVSSAYGLNFSGWTTQSAFFDYDHDGDLDCYLLNQSQKPNENIVDTSKRRLTDPYAGDRLLRNDMKSSTGNAQPQATFTDISSEAGIYQSSLGYGLGLAIADLNNDGWEDIYVGNDFHENDYYYVNNGNGGFTESGAQVFNHYSRFSMGNDVADFNNDGQLDVVTVDMLPDDEKVLKTYGSDENPDIYKLKLMKNGFQHQYSRNCLQRNNGNAESFSDVGLISGMAATDWSWSPLFADFDNDGNKDLLVTSGIVKRPVDLDFVRYVSDLSMQQAREKTERFDKLALEKMPDGSSHPYFFKGDGMLSFQDVSEDWGTFELNGYYNGASYADLDNDGDLEVVINCINAPAVILNNNSSRGKFLSISFIGGGENSHGVGARAYVFQKGKVQLQQLMLTRGFQSSSDSRLHFGLVEKTTIDSVVIVWPDQKFQVLKNVKPDQFLKVDYRQAAGEFDLRTTFNEAQELLQPAELTFGKWVHKENAFDDFNVQYLIPHAQSTRGPKIAVADVNADARDDYFICGAKGQPALLMVQLANGEFIQQDTAVFNADAACEDVDAVFFDANGDKKPDLYVVSGGNQESGNTVSLLDRLYLNDGSGHFIKSKTGLPQIFQNKSCVAALDFDRDGDTDLFVGSLADPRAFGKPQDAHLLVNNGNGEFSIAGNEIIPLSKLGIVTAVTCADINNDQWTDIIVAGEWMPITIFHNKKGRLEKSEIAGSSGLWQNLLVDDVDGDGKLDLLAGNWGWNNKFWSGKNGPVKLYVDDFDNNGQTDQLVSYTSRDVEFPFLAKDEVERAMPLLKKHYLLYEEYAGVPMKDVFFGWIDTVKAYTCERMGSAVCYGNGKGDFVLQDLPAALQLAPIFSFAKVPAATTESVYITGGNFFDVIPYEGRYDAQPLCMFTISKDRKVKYLHQPNLLSTKGQFRDLKWIRRKSNENILLAARNNDGLLGFRMR